MIYLFFRSVGNITDEIVNEYDDDINAELKFFSPKKVTNKSDNANKEKPVLKNCEPVKFDSKLKHLSKKKNMSHSDISILTGDSFLKEQVISFTSFFHIYFISLYL